MASDIWHRSATEIAAAVATGEISAREVVELHLERIGKVNDGVNAVTAVLGDEAVATAERLDRARAAGEPLGPLAGVPVTVKENIDVAGGATTQGLSALAGALATVDAPPVGRLRAAGAVIIGRTNLPDIGMRAHTESDLHGATLNPWDRSITPGGSSGGDAVAVATGMAAVGVGNDVGGSLRIPAQCCGVAGMRPTQGAVAWAGGPGAPEPFLFAQLMATHGPMARHVRDLRVALHAMAGADPRDPWSTGLLPSAPVEGTRRVLVIAEPEGGDTDPAVAAQVRRAADAIADAGYAVDDGPSPPVAAIADALSTIFTTELHAAWSLLEPIMGEGGRRFVELWKATWPPSDAGGLSSAYIVRKAVARQWTERLAGRDLVLAPVMPQPPFRVGFDIESVASAAAVVRSLRMCMVANAAGLPAVAIPTAVLDDVPHGVQIVGPRGHDDACLDAAEVIEAACGTFTPIDPR
jgi:amidase